VEKPRARDSSCIPVELYLLYRGTYTCALLHCDTSATLRNLASYQTMVWLLSVVFQHKFLVRSLPTASDMFIKVWNLQHPATWIGLLYVQKTTLVPPIGLTLWLVVINDNLPRPAYFILFHKFFPKTNTLGKKNKAGLPFGEVDSLFLICFLLQIFWPVGILSNKALLFFIFLFFGMRNKTKQKQTILIRGCLSIEVASLVIALISQSFFSS
jgi:hypothetical protein